MAKYYQRPDGLYETTRTINGRRIRFRGKTCREVDKKILEYKEDTVTGRKIKVIADEWQTYIESRVAIHTYVTYKTVIPEIVELFGSKRAGELRTLDVIRYLSDLERQGYGRSSINLRKAVLSSIFKFAILSGDVETNPVKDAETPKVDKSDKRALTEEEEFKVETYTGDDAWIGLLMLYTGMRVTELIALEYSDFDFEKNVIHVTKKYNRYTSGHIDHHLKSKHGKRDVPIFSALKEVIPKNRIGKVFATDDGDYLSYHQFRVRFDEYKKSVGLPDDITPHSFRHSYMTICFESGISFIDAAAFLGDTQEVAMQVYTELRDTHHVSSAEQVNAFIEMRRDKSRSRQA